MGIFDGCLLACDIDGTLMGNDTIPNENLRKIRFFMDEGGIFSLATGRTLGAVSTVLEILGEVSPSVYGNGCMIYDFSEDRFLHQEFIPDNAKTFVQDILTEMPDVGIEIHSGTDVFVIRETQETIEHESYENIKAKPIDYNEVLQYNWNKVMFLLNSAEQYLKIEALAAKYTDICTFFRTTATVYGKMRNYYEQLSENASKGAGVLKLCELFNIKKGGLYTIGDFFNDIPMLEAADISACPCGSPDEVVAASTVITRKAENGAVADFIDYLTKRKEAENGRTKEN